MTNHQTSDIENSVVAIYGTHDGAARAIKKLADEIPMKKLSMIGKGYHSEEKVVGFYNAGERIRVWGKYGAFWGALWVLLGGGLFVTLPVMGPVMVLGYFSGLVLTAIESAVVVGSLSAIGAALYSMGIPKDSILQYEEAVKTDGFMILLQGTEAEAERARVILKDTGARQIDMHSGVEKSVNTNHTLHLRAAS